LEVKLFLLLISKKFSFRVIFVGLIYKNIIGTKRIKSGT